MRARVTALASLSPLTLAVVMPASTDHKVRTQPKRQGNCKSARSRHFHRRAARHSERSARGRGGSGPRARYRDRTMSNPSALERLRKFIVGRATLPRVPTDRQSRPSPAARKHRGNTGIWRLRSHTPSRNSARPPGSQEHLGPRGSTTRTPPGKAPRWAGNFRTDRKDHPPSCRSGRPYRHRSSPRSTCRWLPKANMFGRSAK
jgi:hypothetical protein